MKEIEASFGTEAKIQEVAPDNDDGSDPEEEAREGEEIESEIEQQPMDEEASEEGNESFRSCGGDHSRGREQNRQESLNDRIHREIRDKTNQANKSMRTSPPLTRSRLRALNDTERQEKIEDMREAIDTSKNEKRGMVPILPELSPNNVTIEKALITINREPNSLSEAKQLPDWHEWEKAIQDELSG